MRGHAGRADYTVYSKIRFPLAEAPAFANSQSFNHWGDCDQTGRVSLGALGKTALYRCRVNDLLLIADESVNYAYPWRDNFCEHRYFFVGDCPGGLGHQGQDIRPSSCTQRIEGANRCEPYQHDVVAARDGIVLRAPGEIALYIVTNTANERVRFRYLHMSPEIPRPGPHGQRTGGARGRGRSARSAISCGASGRPPTTCISTFRCRPNTAGSSSTPTCRWSQPMSGRSRAAGASCCRTGRRS